MKVVSVESKQKFDTIWKSHSPLDALRLTAGLLGTLSVLSICRSEKSFLASSDRPLECCSWAVRSLAGVDVAGWGLWFESAPMAGTRPELGKVPVSAPSGRRWSSWRSREEREGRGSPNSRATTSCPARHDDVVITSVTHKTNSEHSTWHAGSGQFQLVWQ